jgi:hypothetical protein
MFVASLQMLLFQMLLFHFCAAAPLCRHCLLFSASFSLATPSRNRRIGPSGGLVRSASPFLGGLSDD